MEFWAQRKAKKVGPYPTREEALSAFRRAYPFTGPRYEAEARRNQITTGYGAYGPWFDVRWDYAREESGLAP